eukprot:m51a1_g5403 putative cation calcium exchanger 5-like (632) ;mRNA; f:64035-69390
MQLCVLLYSFYGSMMVWLLVLFYATAAIAESHFCPVLSCLSTSLRMSPDLAGLTLLAFGNGAADVFSGIASITDGDFGIMMGQFIVVGAIPFVQQPQLKASSFLRDTLFYAVALVLVMAICIDGSVNVWEALAFLVYYAVFIGFAVGLHYWKLYKANTKPMEYMEIVEWNSKRPWEKAVHIVTLPVTLAFNVTMPHGEKGRYRPWLFVVASTFSTVPALVAFRVTTASIAHVPVVAWTCTASLAISLAIVVTFRKRDELPEAVQTCVLLYSFCAAMVWIYLIADEVVSLLTVFGTIFRVSPSLLGLTVLSFGNSLTDFVASLTVARQGQPEMAMAAAYAGPLFNMLIGLGVGLTVACVRSYPTPYSIAMTDTTVIGFIFMAGSLAVTIVVVPLRKYVIEKWFGATLIVTYAGFLALSVMADLGHLRPAAGGQESGNPAAVGRELETEVLMRVAFSNWELRSGPPALLCSPQMWGSGKTFFATSLLSLVRSDIARSGPVTSSLLSPVALPLPEGVPDRCGLLAMRAAQQGRWSLDDAERIAGARLVHVDLLRRPLDVCQTFRQAVLGAMYKIATGVEPTCELRSDPAGAMEVHVWDLDHKFLTYGYTDLAGFDNNHAALFEMLRPFLIHKVG